MSSAPTHKSALSLSFGREADRYDQARPSYPRAVAEAISRHADALIGRALEVGAGTGKGTEILVAAGVKEIVALEPDPDMAARLEGTIDGVTVRVEPFEAYTTDRPYDVLLSTQAWHWLDPRMRLAKAASCVRAGGVLALVWNVYGIADHDVHKETSAWAERWKVELKLPLLDESTRIMVPWPEKNPNIHFERPKQSVFSQNHFMTAADFCRLVGSFSQILVRTEAQRSAMLTDLRARLARHVQVEVRVRTTLHMARRLAA